MSIKFDKSETLLVFDYNKKNRLSGSHLLTYSDRSLISGKWLIPARSTTKTPPERKKGYDIYFNPEIDDWKYREKD